MEVSAVNGFNINSAEENYPIVWRFLKAAFITEVIQKIKKSPLTGK